MNGFWWGVIIVALIVLAAAAGRQDADSTRRNPAPPAVAPAAEDARLAAVRAKLPTAATDVRSEGGDWYSFSLKLPDGNRHRYLVAVWFTQKGAGSAWAIARADGP